MPDFRGNHLFLNTIKGMVPELIASLYLETAEINDHVIFTRYESDIALVSTVSHLSFIHNM